MYAPCTTFHWLVDPEARTGGRWDKLNVMARNLTINPSKRRRTANLEDDTAARPNIETYQMSNTYLSPSAWCLVPSFSFCLVLVIL